MGKVEGVPHFVGSSPEDHPLHPVVWIWVSRRRLGNERVIEYSGSLAVVGADVIEHDATKRCALFMQGSEEHPHSPLRLSNEARPVGLHGIVHLDVAPLCIETSASQR